MILRPLSIQYITHSVVTRAIHWCVGRVLTPGTSIRVAKVSADAYGIMTYVYGIMTFAPLVQFAYVETQKWCSHMRRHVVPKFCLVNSHSNLLGVLTLNLGLITNIRKMTGTKVKVPSASAAKLLHMRPPLFLICQQPFISKPHFLFLPAILVGGKYSLAARRALLNTINS